MMEFRKKSYFVHSPKANVHLNHLSIDEVQTVLTFVPPHSLADFYVCDSIDKTWQPLMGHPTIKPQFESRKDLKTPPIPGAKPPPAAPSHSRATEITQTSPAQPTTKTITRTQVLPNDAKPPTSSGLTTTVLLEIPPPEIQVSPLNPIHYFFDEHEYKSKIQSWKYPYFSLSNRIQGHSSIELRFVFETKAHHVELIAGFDYDEADFVDTQNDPGVVKTARFKIKSFKARVL